MVASIDLTRYEPPLDYLLGRIDQLTRLLEHQVDPGFVREEAATVLQELCSFCRRRIDLNEVEARIRASTAIDVGALQTGLSILEQASRDELFSPDSLATKLANTHRQLELLREKQHTFKFLEVGLRVELLFESVFQDAMASIVDDWDPTAIVTLTREKVELLSDQRRRELWTRVLSEFRPLDPDEDEEVADYRFG